jgi:hypothetical protein
MNYGPVIERQLECSKCHATVKVGCNCGVAYLYVKAGVRAAEALAAHPEKSDRAIAEEVGVSDMTVGRARKLTATNVAVEGRLGKDGKKRKSPIKRRPVDIVQRQASINVKPDQWEAFKATADAEGVSAAEKLGRYVAAPEIDSIDISEWSGTQQEKFERALQAAQRVFQRENLKWRDEQLAQIDVKVEARVKEIKAEWRKASQDVIDERRNLQRMYNNYKPPFTVEQFRTIVRVLHPDNSASPQTRDEAFRLFNDKKLQLTGKK